MSLHKLEGTYYEAYKNQVRDAQAPTSSLPPVLAQLGRQVAAAIMADALTTATNVSLTTPQGKTVTGPIPKLPQTLVITTKEERSHLGVPIQQELGALYTGYLSFGNIRGNAVLTAKPVEAAWPVIEEQLKLLVIAKSVLASGCTALALAQNAIARFQPAQVIIASIFYSDEGISQMQSALPNVRIYVLGEADYLTKDGMLEPGVGLLEERLPGDVAPLFDEVPALVAAHSAPDKLMQEALRHIDELEKQGLSKPTSLEAYGLAVHYVNQFVAAQSTGLGSPFDLVSSLSLGEAEATLQAIRHPSGRRNSP
ncbi:hypothetical protein EHF33_20440 (plasmid) [Deinococcus psychrotolerans]|uniref:Phosphoribosyltransferase domain-containing protein n=1 Tax=Deinococcus psychrotolerans TaxID=2489213 RepID=A0A3G8YUJ8_9DEIO|nr:uracil phosphoribosyltransferase [Deinococcus psychrotolerans]AZI45281.1 hypothetical protein EHF33_20440 [Deinococcus psychrotolerans]